MESHDNETLFDAIQLKLPRWLPMAERVRAQNLGLSLVALGQGVPFVHAGMEMLRSKSLDRNSYDSGDWFNRLDFSYRSNNWGVGLPPAEENERNWAVLRPLLADPALRPAEAHIRRSVAHFKELLRIRRSSRLFRLRSAREVSRHLRFHNTGPHQLPGLLAWSLEDPEGRIDPAHPLIVVLWNAAATSASLGTRSFGHARLRLHPIQVASDDPVLRAADATQIGSGARTDDRGLLEPAGRMSLPFAGSLWLAPLTRGGHLAFRRLCVEFGAQVTVGEMAMARRLLREDDREFALLRSHPDEPCFGVQLAGNKPEALAEAARLAEQRGARFVDLNCGCPIHQITGRGLGASLLQKPARIARLVEAMRRAIGVPVTVKLRTGYREGKANVAEVARACEEAGAASLAIHGRSREQRYNRAADWDLIGRVAAERRIPVVGNGDILTHYEASGAGSARAFHP